MGIISKIKMPDESTARDLVDLGAVRYDTATALNSEQKALARNNIGAADTARVEAIAERSVHYTEDDVSESEIPLNADRLDGHPASYFAQTTALESLSVEVGRNSAARHSHENKSILDTITQAMIDAIGTIAQKYVKPLTGIPKTDLASGVQSSLDKADSALQADALVPYRVAVQQDLIDSALQNLIDAINGKIPSQATSSNQLADKQFVNSSIGTNTANYISNAGQPFISVAQLEAYTGTVTNNDYAFVTGTDSEGNTYFDRYKATISGSSVSWAREYRLNNSSFTATQWEAITSGITNSLVGLIETALQPSDLTPYRTSSAQDSIDAAIAGRVGTIEGKEGGWDGKYDKPTNGIPKTDLDSGVQSSLAKADSALQAYNIRYVVEDEE